MALTLAPERAPNAGARELRNGSWLRENVDVSMHRRVIVSWVDAVTIDAAVDLSIPKICDSRTRRRRQMEKFLASRSPQFACAVVFGNAKITLFRHQTSS